MDKGKECILAIDVGGTFFKSALVTVDGQVIEDSLLSEPANSAGPADGIKNCYQNILRKQYSFAKSKCCDVIGIGIDTPGPFDFVNSKSKMKHKFQSIYDIPLKPWITEAAGDTPVLFIHDSSAFVIGESWQGAAKEYDNIAKEDIKSFK
jgi:glucokinase